MTVIDLETGTHITRAELNSRYGGGIQGGMLTPAGGSLMFLFSDPVSGETYGYTSDGWADAKRTRYDYTGEGSIGPQAIDRGKNKILLESIETGRKVHLFHAVDTLPGSRTRVHEYLGEFVLDASNPWRPEQTLDEDRQPRTAVVFHLLRLDGRFSPSPAAQIEAEHPARETNVAPIDRESSDRTVFERAAVAALTAERRERLLEDRIIDWFAANNQTAMRLRIRIAGERGALLTDTWIPESRTLLEVKGDATRNDIRMAVAQLLDYGRHISPPPSRSAVVVPIQPTDDLQDYVRSVGLSLAVFDSRGLTYLIEQ